MLTVFLIAIGLAMDALSVSIVSGLKASHICVADAIKVGACFGFFQAIMPYIGYAVGGAFQERVHSLSGYIAFGMLFAIGAKMIYESRTQEEVSGLSFKTLIGLGIATSIDALVVGTTLNLVDLPVLVSVISIGIITFALSLLGYIFGSKLGSIFGQRVEIFGGLVLIGIGVSFLF